MKIIFHHWLERIAAGITPDAYSTAFQDWLNQLARSPEKQVQLIFSFWQSLSQLQLYTANTIISDNNKDNIIDPEATDRRFKADEWQKYPYNIYQQAFLLYRNWWQQATHNIKDVEPHNLDLVSFTIRQMIDAIAPF